ncbi:hypothetical protein ACOME3_000688 [Neoechinorhynchus agilis]
MTSISFIVNYEINFWHGSDCQFRLPEVIDQLFSGIDEVSQSEVRTRLDQFLDIVDRKKDNTLNNKGTIQALIKSILYLQSSVYTKYTKQKRLIIVAPGSNFYVPGVDFLNCASSCKHLSIKLDTIRLKPLKESTKAADHQLETILKQASLITNGMFIMFDSIQGFWSSLVSSVLCPKGMCPYKDVDNQSIQLSKINAVCSCHEQKAEIFYACTICAAIHCKPFVHCAFCSEIKPTRLDVDQQDGSSRKRTMENYLSFSRIS